LTSKLNQKVVKVTSLEEIIRENVYVYVYPCEY